MNTDTTEKISRSLIIKVIALASLTFMGIFSETSLNIAYASLMAEFHISASTIQWLTTGYLLVLSIGIPVSTFLVRKFHTRRLFQVAALTFALGTIIASLAPSFPLLLTGRLIMAAGTGISLPLLMNIVLEEAPAKQRGLLLGVVGLVTNFAPAVGPVVGGILMAYLNWHWIFIAMIPILVFSLLSGSMTVRDIRKGGKPVLDFISFSFSALAMSGIIIGLSFGESFDWNIKIWGIFGIAAVSLVFFSLRQLRIKSPLIDIRLFRIPMFTIGLGMIVIAQAIVLAVNFLLPILLQRAFQSSSLMAALILLPGAAFSGLFSPLTGALLRKHHPGIFLKIGFFIVSLTLILFMKFSYSPYVVMAVYAGFMFGAAFIQIPAQTNTLNQLSSEKNADGSALVNTLQQLSGAVGTALGANLLTVKISHASLSVSNISKINKLGFEQSLPLFLVLALFGLGLGFFTRKSTGKPI